MSKVERFYREAIVAMTPKERVARGFRLHSEIYGMLKAKISREFPDLPPREIEKRVAQRMYLRDKRAQNLLKRIL